MDNTNNIFILQHTIRHWDSIKITLTKIYIEINQDEQTWPKNTESIKIRT